MRQLAKEKQFSLFHEGLEPAYVVKPGDIVLVECSHGLPGLVTRDGRFSEPRPQDRVNPATGPIYVEGIKPGDALAIDILDIRTGNWGYCNQRVYEISDGCVIPNPRLRLPIQPMLGVAGIAPAQGSMDTKAPADTGGNMDCRDVRAGSTLVFTAQVTGALAGFGDAHALQGNGEISGQGIETDAEVLMRFRLLPERLSPRPVILRSEWVATLGAHQDLTEAAWQATDDMAKLLARMGRREKDEARLLVNLLGQLRINQIVDPNGRGDTALFRALFLVLFSTRALIAIAGANCINRRFPGTVHGRMPRNGADPAETRREDPRESLAKAIGPVFADTSACFGAGCEIPPGFGSNSKKPNAKVGRQ